MGRNPVKQVNCRGAGARRKPDGRRIAFIDNRDGNTALRVVDVIGGATRTLVAKNRAYKAASSRLLLDIVDEHGKRTPARVSVPRTRGLRGSCTSRAAIFPRW